MDKASYTLLIIFSIIFLFWLGAKFKTNRNYSLKTKEALEKIRINIPEDQIEKEINRSLWPTLWCCRAVLPFMIEQQSGAIVNVGSVATRGVNRVPYSAAKGGVQAITTCMALELAEHNIRVNCVNPGGVDQGERATPRHTGEMTDIDKAGMQGVVEQTMRDTPMKRYGTPEEEAAAICFLAADESSYITGETINVAGGGIG